MTNEDRDNLLLYAAGALDTAETAALETRLAQGTPDDIAALAEAQAVLAQLSLALPRETPSADAKKRLLAAILSPGSEMKPEPRVNLAPAMERASKAVRKPFIPTYMGVAAATLMFAVSLALVWHERQKTAVYVSNEKSLCTEIAELKTQLVQRTVSVESLHNQLAALKGAVAAERLQMVSLDKTATAGTARGRILWDKSANQWVVAVFDLMPPANGREYELWFITADQKTIRSKTFNTNAATGEAVVTVDVPPDLKNITLAAITDEPIGGVDKPTGSIHLKGKVE